MNLSRKSAIATLVIAGLVATLAWASVPALSQGPVVRETGTLDFFASAALGDGFRLILEGATSATLTETFTASSQARITESGANLTQLVPTGPGSASQLFVGLKDHVIGVRASGEGNGTPAAQVNNAGTSGQTLTIALGPDAPGSGAWYAQLGLKFKFGATVRVQALDAANNPVGAPAVVTCAGSDCGPASGNDRLLVTVGSATSATVFTKLRISIDAPSDGAVALIDDPAAGFDTFLSLVDSFDGELACDDTAVVDDGTISGAFTRLNTTTITAGCSTLKVYNLDIVGGEVRFVPNQETVSAQYRGDLRFPAGVQTNPLTDDIEYDKDGPGPAPFVLMQWCALRAADASELNDYPELAGIGPAGSDLFPTLAGLALEGGLAPTSCVVAFSTAQGGDDHWVVHLEGDPFYK